MNIKRSRLIQALPWGLALVGLAVPMIGSGFVGWPFVVAWLVVLVLVYLVRPLRDADRMTRIISGIAALITLALLSTVGGLYLVPAVIAWMASDVSRGESIREGRESDPASPRRLERLW
ncbi:MAG: hypothetical protein QOD50_1297 [Actinomycetota bacterium]|nr:hypothetical protein [Actinomycetota bacterium]